MTARPAFARGKRRPVEREGESEEEREVDEDEEDEEEEEEEADVVKKITFKDKQYLKSHQEWTKL